LSLSISIGTLGVLRAKPAEVNGAGSEALNRSGDLGCVRGSLDAGKGLNRAFAIRSCAAEGKFSRVNGNAALTPAIIAGEMKRSIGCLLLGASEMIGAGMF
jgi:hypothetical protein